MATFRQVQLDFWDDEDFENKRFVIKSYYTFLYTNRLCNLTGVYKPHQKSFKSMTNLTSNQQEKYIRELEKMQNESGVPKVKREGKWIWVTALGKRIEGTNQVRAAHKILAEIPDDLDLKRQFLQKYPRIDRHYRKFIRDKGLSNPLPKGSKPPTEGVIKDKDKDKIRKDKIRKDMVSSEVAYLQSHEKFNSIRKPEKLMVALKESRPDVNILAELKEMNTYLLAHPHKIYKNYAAFIRNWIVRTDKDKYYTPEQQKPEETLVQRLAREDKEKKEKTK